jgi:Cytochrome c7 and related cytochrome c
MTARARLLLFALVSVAACATAMVTLRNPVADEILFPHARHAKAGVECITCHDGVWDETALGKPQLPPEAKCLECHKAKKESRDCNFCHSEPQLAAAWPTPEPHLKFNHSKHIDLVKEDCKVCHIQLSEPRADKAPVEGHGACLSCHEGPHPAQFAQARCDTCHVDLKRYPMKPVVELSHQGDFVKNHAIAARAAGQSCAACHEQNFCLDCHTTVTALGPPGLMQPDRPDRNFIHRNDWLSHHPIDAAADPASCRSCHAPRSCDACHNSLNVGAAGSNPRNPHPPGWSARGFGVAFHGDAARRDINSCASCHDQGAQSNCVTCHKVGGVGGDPHPTGFSSQHSLQESRTNSMCLTCHR